MFAPFPEEQAYEVCLSMIDELESGSLELKQVTVESVERCGHGIMLGAAVCQAVCGRIVILKTVSGISRELYRVSGVANGICDSGIFGDTCDLSKFCDFCGRCRPDFFCALNDSGCSKDSCGICRVYERDEVDVAARVDECDGVLFVQNEWRKLPLCNGYAEIFVSPIVDAKKINDALYKNDALIHELTEKINQLKEKRRCLNGKCLNQSDEEQKLCEKRLFLCNESLKAVYELYSFCCFDGKRKSLFEILNKNDNNFENYAVNSWTYNSKSVKLKNQIHLPPTGTGDCCAPKLLDYAFSHKMKVLSMAEVFFGKNTKSKIHKKVYPPCDQRCSLILPEMIGLKIIYRDKDIIVVEKPSGLLSVPGKSDEKQDSVSARIKNLFPWCIEQPSVHRLDMDTSGLLVLAFTKTAHDNLCMQFEKKLVEKKYKAILDGNIFEAKGNSAPNGDCFLNFDNKKDNPPLMSAEDILKIKNYREPKPKNCELPRAIVSEDKKSGEMELYFRVDLLNRPFQIWDTCYGKKSVTKWAVSGSIFKTEDGRTFSPVEFIPITGRTHQLRLASADIHGFGMPIVGDSLYNPNAKPGEKLMLHSYYLSFFHPVTGKKMEFISIPLWEK